MKKFLSILLIAIMLLSCFVACDSKDSKEEDNAKESTQDSTPTYTQGSINNNTTESGKENTGNNTNNTTNNTTNNNNASNAQTDEEKYNSACSLISQKKYTEAYSILKSIKSYEPAKAKLKNFFYAPEKIYESWTYVDSNSSSDRATEYVYDQMGNILETSDDEIFTYDDDGNVLTGVDLIYGDPFWTYTYKDGKLYQMKTTSNNRVQTYNYNTDGTIKSVEHNSDYGGAIYVYEYTYYASGKVKTMKVDYVLYTYDENGKLIQADFVNEDGEKEGTMKATYGEFGITKLNADVYGMQIDFTYSYDSNGKLISLLAKAYEEGTLYSTHTIEYVRHQLYYSENPSVQARLSQITFTDFEAALDIVM